MKKLVFALLAIASIATAQDGLIVGSGNFFSPIVGDLEKAIAFYRDGLGLDIQGAPSNAEQNAPLRNMFGLPDAQLRWTVGRPPAMRTGVEIVEIKKADSKPAERRVQDPGAFTLIVLVRDIDAAFAKVKQAAAPVVTAGGRPIAVGRAKAFVTRDPDGHFVEVAQLNPLPETTAPETANVIGVRVRLTVEDAGQSMRQSQALGLNGTMYSWLYEHTFVFRGFRAPARFAILACCAASVLAGFGWLVTQRLCATAPLRWGSTLLRQALRR